MCNAAYMTVAANVEGEGKSALAKICGKMHWKIESAKIWDDSNHWWKAEIKNKNRKKLILNKIISKTAAVLAFRYNAYICMRA